VAVEWERQPGEPAKAYAAFCVYRDLPASERSLTAAYGRHSGKNARAPGFWAEWSRDWLWVERAAAYDAYLDGERRRIREARLAEIEARRAEFAWRHQAQLEEWVATLDTALKRALRSAKNAPLSSIARLLRERNETARMAIEGPPARLAGESSDAPAGPGAIEWIPPKPEQDGGDK